MKARVKAEVVRSFEWVAFMILTFFGCGFVVDIRINYCYYNCLNHLFVLMGFYRLVWMYAVKKVG